MAADSITVARPYADAAFRRAQETGRLDEWSAMLELLASIVGQDEIKGLLGNPKVSSELLLGILLDVTGDRLTEEGKNLLRLLVENKRLAVLPEITTGFESLKKEAEGLIHVRIRSAFALTESEENQLIEMLGKRLGKRVALTVVEDPALIGGVEIRAGDLVIDGSVRGRLSRLTSELQF